MWESLEDQYNDTITLLHEMLSKLINISEKFDKCNETVVKAGNLTAATKIEVNATKKIINNIQRILNQVIFSFSIIIYKFAFSRGAFVIQIVTHDNVLTIKITERKLSIFIMLLCATTI